MIIYTRFSHVRESREKKSRGDSSRDLFRTPTLYSNLESDPDVIIYFSDGGVDGTVMIVKWPARNSRT